MRSDRKNEDLFDEARLRRALRLDAAELPARIDVAASANIEPKGYSNGRQAF